MGQGPRADRRAAIARGFGAYLIELRKLKAMSLRQVEEASKELGDAEPISNAYLSQLENDKVTDPSPRVLHTLAKLYGASYATLMKKAGYFMPAGGARLATFADEALTEEEEREALAYIAFRRKQDKERE
jgi:transcriptional regulator with XRE-family HTH domain